MTTKSFVLALVASIAVSYGAQDAYAQNVNAEKLTGMGGAEQTLRAKGNVKGADQIARARCFSGLGACNGKFVSKRARAARAQHHR